MNSHHHGVRRILVPVVLSLILAAETIVAVAAESDQRATSSVIPAPAAAAPALRARERVTPVAVARTRQPGQLGNPTIDPAEFAPVAQPEPVAPKAAEAVRVQPAQGTPKAKSVSKSTTPSKSAKSSPTAKSTSTSSSTTYKGRNRMWMPALGINRAVSFFSCTSTAYPGDRVYRWGCAGRNNVYLFGHAHSVFKPLHDAYVRGRLRKGMKVVYADGNGKVRTYKIAWWKVTTPEKGEFAYAAQSRPSMTLQTCVGSRSQYRLVVRLVLAS